MLGGLSTNEKRYSRDKWIKKSETKDIGDKPNPFQIRSEALKQTLLQTCLQADKIEMAALATGQAYASIERNKIQSFVELMKNMKVVPDPNYDVPHVKAELIITDGESIMLAVTYIQFLGTRTWMKNRNCLLLKDETIYKKIKKLFEIYPEFKQIIILKDVYIISTLKRSD